MTEKHFIGIEHSFWLTYWIGFCECGWRGKKRRTIPAADYDARSHYAETHP